MQIGFNNDVEHDGVRYHIQTEDHGLDDGRITSQVFRGGQILDTVTVSYSKAIAEIDDGEERDEEIRKRMKALHAHCFRLIKQDKYGEKSSDEEDGTELDEEEADLEEADADSEDDAPEKPKMPSEPAPAPGIGRGRPLSGLRQLPPLPSDATEEQEIPRSLSDTDEDAPVAARESLDDLVPEELAQAIVDEMKNAGVSDEDEQPSDEPGDATIQMAPLPDDLPEGIGVAGIHDDLGPAMLASHMRGLEMSEEEMAAVADIDEIADPQPPPVYDPMYGPQKAFRGIDIEPEEDLPALLVRLAG